MNQQTANLNEPKQNFESSPPKWVGILTVILLTALIILLFVNRERIQQLEKYGYAGIFLISIATNATLIIPLPGVAITTTMGAIFNPFGVAVAAGLGAAIGEITGYTAGYTSQGLLKRNETYQKLTANMREHPQWAVFIIFILAFIPNPMMDLAGMAAGSLKVPLWKYFIPCTLGKILKMLLFAYLGHYSLSFF